MNTGLDDFRILTFRVRGRPDQNTLGDRIRYDLQAKKHVYYWFCSFQNIPGEGRGGTFILNHQFFFFMTYLFLETYPNQLGSRKMMIG